MATHEVNGVRLYYEAHGTGEPILCIHGTGSSSELWSGAADALARRGRTIVYDRRGFSRSERPEPLELDVHLHADDAAALLDGLDATPAIVIGRSQGGEIAVDLALRYPDRVRALALLEGGGLAIGETFRRWLVGLDEIVYAAAETHPEGVGEAMVRAVAGDMWDELPELMRRIFTENGPAIVAEHRGGLLDVTREQLASISQPTLVVAADESLPGLAEVTDTVASTIPAARLVRVAGGHLIDPAHPVVLAFLDEVLS